MIDRVVFSESDDGEPILVDQTATPGTLVHTTEATERDEIWLYAQNNDTEDRLLTIEFGGVSSPKNLVQKTVPSKDGTYVIIPGWMLTNSKAVRAFAAAANVIGISGHANRLP